ncbi:MAG: DUF4867 family protein [Spirochaetes bacterium]|nr:DUF4867 family protein [Spirochaetota bacterium]
MIDRLRALNPDVRILRCTDPDFERFGRIVPGLAISSFTEFLDAFPVPVDGVEYRAGVPELEGMPLAAEIRDRVFGGLAIQAGTCTGRNGRMNAMEWHKSSEVIVAGTDLLLFLGLLSDYRDGSFPPLRASAFFLPRGTVVELYPLVLHFAPINTDVSGFRAVIVLPVGTNLPLEAKASAGADRLLFARNKWLIAHADSKPARGGACVGIHGDNPEIRIK